MPKYQPKQKYLKLSEYFKQYKIRKNNLFRHCVDVATQTSLYRRLQDVVNQTSSRRRKTNVLKTSLRRKMSKDASFIIIFDMLLICIQVKQKRFITADVIGTIQNNTLQHFT